MPDARALEKADGIVAERFLIARFNDRLYPRDRLGIKRIFLETSEIIRNREFGHYSPEQAGPDGIHPGRLHSSVIPGSSATVRARAYLSMMAPDQVSVA